jgi:2-keto-4-pentenoate hydratase/2-oxohepta-3-ene-1,7-dioic acid hydratase in catechol pathway
MRFCRFATNQGSRYGVVELLDGMDMITALLPVPKLEMAESGTPERVVVAAASEAKKLDEPLPLSKATLLTPLPFCSKIVCVGENYRPHIVEMGHEVPREPVIFLKPPSALLAAGGVIQRPKCSERVDHEGELAVVIGRRCRHLKEGADLSRYILGYTIVNDVTARDLQKTDGQWARAKGFDTFCPVGPVIATGALDTVKGVAIQTVVNGELRQDGNTKDFLFPLDRLLRHISQFCTLLPGDIVSTGTPAGVGPLVHGDVVEIWVEGVGILRNFVANEAQ